MAGRTYPPPGRLKDSQEVNDLRDDNFNNNEDPGTQGFERRRQFRVSLDG